MQIPDLLLQLQRICINVTNRAVYLNLNIILQTLNYIAQYLDPFVLLAETFG